MLARQSNVKTLLFAVSLATVTLAGPSAWALPFIDTLSPQNLLIGATPAVEALGNNGAGITFGVIDTGGQAQWVGFHGRINTGASTCIISGCAQSLSTTDDQGHGTFVTSEIIGYKPAIGLEGVDPAASAIEVKVLAAVGGGSNSDVSTGIIYAANHGAQILNLSLGPSGGTPAQQAADYGSFAAAVNYAASKNVIVVFAGGNSSQPFVGGANITGFTSSAIQHMFFMGSTDANKALSFFSNTPGSGGFISNGGRFFPYASMWLMADGENINGASNQLTSPGVYNSLTVDSGTSMSAPQGAGAAGLLASRWPFLIAQGTIPAILENSAERLAGSNKINFLPSFGPSAPVSGINNTYGDGFLQVNAAMQPLGSLSIPVGGSRVASAGVSNSVITVAGALGNLWRVSSVLQSAVAYDSYHRDFPVNLGGAISSVASTGSSPSTSQVMGQSGSGARHLVASGDDGSSWLAFSGSQQAMPTHDANDDPTRSLPAEWSFSSMNEGRYVGVGYGSGAPLSFNDARWGEATTFFNNTNDMSGSLLGLVANGDYAVSGLRLTDHSLLSIGMIRTNTNNLYDTLENNPTAQGFAFGYTVEPSDNWKVSLTSSYLNEHNMLLGSISTGVLGLGGTNTTQSMGIGTRVNLGNNYQLGLDAVYASTDKSADQNSVISNISALSSMAYNVEVTKANFTGNDDNIGIAIGKPLRIIGGSAEVDVPVGTDNNGNPIINRERTSLVPTGNETDLSLNYTRPIAEDINSGFSLSYRNDAANIAGVNDAAAMLHMDIKF